MKKRDHSWFKRWWKLLLAIYVLLLVGSHALLFLTRDREPAGASERNILEVEGQNLSYMEWGGANKNKPPVILLHGSPSRGAMDFRNLGPELAKDGRRVIAIDRWGLAMERNTSWLRRRCAASWPPRTSERRSRW